MNELGELADITFIFACLESILKTQRRAVKKRESRN